ncbi:MAG TPA: diaminopimelate epimerase [Actinomycetes bacterium]|nr:diaminopimelate epimerase [Actinomycetes bacterium]
MGSDIGSSNVGRGVEFVKGHGTQNDFVVLFDADGAFEPSEGQVRALCDRRRGLGADGVLRAVPDASGAWFMDYRNADGSVAEMCGNGSRLFAVALRDAGLVDADEFPIVTRGGVRQARIGSYDGSSWTVSMSMGAAHTSEQAVSVCVLDDGRPSPDREWPAMPVWVPNPHAVVVVHDLAEAGRLTVAPQVLPQSVFPDGVNVEFVVDRGLDPVNDDGTPRIGMRVHERGVGETRSCGTGAVAAAWAWRRRVDGVANTGSSNNTRSSSTQSNDTVRVDVPGGTVYVTEHDDGELSLTGPAVIVARGRLDEQWWKENA